MRKGTCLITCCYQEIVDDPSSGCKCVVITRPQWDGALVISKTCRQARSLPTRIASVASSNPERKVKLTLDESGYVINVNPVR
jgi:hypothetical protein